ncbi:component of small subunit processosome extracellular mutant DEAH-box protein [Scheffersomyces coipomensis]|uniref:component of small subunit processosome extracellular mutant DEAH-box protein n=1 Tax=Scheffersomyces coipomensis TaxID=1788519 RepID=UPI00315C86CD
MGKYRKRFNEKARSGMLAKQATLKKARQKQFHRDIDGDAAPVSEDVATVKPIENSNAEILQPVTEEEKQERKRKLEETLYSNQKESKISRTKKKRLDKYIEHQLKREEKKTLFEKLAKTKVDTSMFAPSKELGKGKQTKKEEFVEALELERQGRGDERTKDILYEERQVLDWSDREDGSGDDDAEEDIYGDFGPSDNIPKSSFVDNRPAKFGGSGSGFGFANLPKIEKTKTAPSHKKYTWRLKVDQEERKRHKIEDENDFLSDSDEEEEDEDDDEEPGTDDEVDNEEVDVDDEEIDGDINVDEANEADDSDDEEEEEEEDDDDDDEDEDDDDDDDEEESETEDDDETPRLMQRKPKHSAVAESFKQWAEQQVRKMEGRDVEYVMPELSEKAKEELKETVHEEDFDHSSDEEGYIAIDKTLQREAFYVDVTRSDEIQKQRVNLPVFGEEHRIMEAIYHHDCIIICGETGSGKTTQVPQFLYEAGFGNVENKTYPGMIGITQPRRVAAVSMAERVGNELGDHGKRVGYQIRFDTTIKNEGTADGTAMKFMTDGVLLREMMTDFLLNKYSCIIIDEAHERNINTDILIGMLSRILKLRRSYHTENPDKYKPLKLIIMSATLRVSDFSENSQLFKIPPPIIKVDARQYPVSVHFNKKTHFEYQDEAFRKASKIHRKLPPGGILIFLTGQNEITSLVKKLRAEFPFKKKSRQPIYDANSTNIKSSKQNDLEAEEIDFSVKVEIRENNDKFYEDLEINSGDVDEEEFDVEDEEGFDEQRESHQTDNDPLYVLPLYSLLPTKQQMKVFEEPPAGSRLCVVATNVAETSLTIPGIRYVIDCGRAKERKFNEENGVQSFEIDWISKASSDQRAGRAGRTGPGHCYRLFSSAIYESYFPQFSRPEILRMPFESIVLSMKSMGIDQIANFPFPTPPDRKSLSNAERLLTILGALDNENKNITELGRTMSLFPLSPRFAKILILGNQLGCLPYIVAIVSALSVGDPFIGENELGLRANNSEDAEEEENKRDTEEVRLLRTKYNHSRAQFARLDNSSDGLMLLSAVCAFDHVPTDKRSQFLGSNFLRGKVMEEIIKLRKQVNYIVKISTSTDSISQQLTEKEVKLGVPDKKQISAIKQMLAAGFIDQVAIRGDLVSSDITIPNKSHISNIPYKPVFPIHGANHETAEFAYIHANSVINSSGTIPGNYLVYQTLSTGNNTKEGQVAKVRMKPLVEIKGKQLTSISRGSPLLTYSKPLGHPYAPKNISPSKREAYVVPRFGAAIGSGGTGWDLPAIKVIQEKKEGSWIIEKHIL